MQTARLTLCASFVLIASAASGQKDLTPVEELTPVRAFRAFDRHNARGLPQATVRPIVQDAEGVLWLGTMDGLASFDGTEIREAPPAPGGVSFGAVNAITLRRRGGLYVGSTGGLHQYDGRTWTFIPPRRTVVGVAEGGDDRLWVLDQTGTLWRSKDDPVTGWERIEHPAWPGAALSVTAARDEVIWVAATHGLVRIVGGRIPGRTISPPPSDSAITVLLVDQAGGCWVGTHAGEVWHVRPGGTSWAPAAAGRRSTSAVTSLAMDRRGRLWAGSAAGELAFFRPGPGATWTTWHTVHGLHHSAGVMAVFADREGSLWFGENGRGVQQWIGEGWTHRTEWDDRGHPVPAGGVFGITARPGGGLFAAVFSKGLWVWDGRRLRQHGAADGLTENTRCAVEPRPGLLWVGARYGIWESVNGGRFRQTLTLPSGFVSSLAAAPDGTWYAITSVAGVFAHRHGRWVPDEAINRHLPDLYARDMKWLSTGELWVATMGGVTAYREGVAERIRIASDPTLSPAVNCILEVAPGEVWVGGYAGIGVRTRGQWRVLTARDGLPGRTIYSLARAPDGSVWAGGSAGVGHVVDGRWTRYDSRNGLIDEECNTGGLFIDDTGHVHVGTMGGLAHFDPSVSPPKPPRLFCYWRRLPPAGPEGVPTLPARTRRLDIGWSAPWLLPTPVQYRTRIRPLSEAWSEATSRPDLVIESLGAGTWTIEVQARLEGSGPEGWSPAIASRVRVAPRFRETIWADLLALLAFAAVSVLAVRWRTRRLAARQRDLQQAVAEAQASVKTLRGMIPICASCKKIRDDLGSWKQLEAYVLQHSEAEFSHGVCPDCLRRLYPDYMPLEHEPTAQATPRSHEER